MVRVRTGKQTEVEGIVNAEVRSGGSGGSGEETPVTAAVIRRTTKIEFQNKFKVKKLYVILTYNWNYKLYTT
ncbi:hypothetical protein Bca52824_045371 [Brassica carinata]|uniref:Uncharacterized protein n=1 Tax=Brassica carinata TaxID=52824 RepID=A0A8X7UP43_BRACI|nr:hypothetical protein Bca52824_045371 [Brassica carinata]